MFSNLLLSRPTFLGVLGKRVKWKNKSVSQVGFLRDKAEDVNLELFSGTLWLGGSVLWAGSGGGGRLRPQRNVACSVCTYGSDQQK